MIGRLNSIAVMTTDNNTYTVPTLGQFVHKVFIGEFALLTCQLYRAIVAAVTLKLLYLPVGQLQ